jgi:hypothetical protein
LMHVTQLTKKAVLPPGAQTHALRGSVSWNQSAQLLHTLPYTESYSH